MSLINRVVRELDRRRDAHTPVQVLPVGVRAAPPLPPRQSYAWVGLFLLAGVVGAGTAWWWLVTHRPTRPSNEAARPSNEPPMTTPIVRAPAPAPPAAVEHIAAESSPAARVAPEQTPKQTSAAPRERPAASTRTAPQTPASTTTMQSLREPRATPEPSPQTSAEQAEAAFKRGLELQRNHQIAEAERAWRDALQLDSGHDLARRALASLLAGRGDQEGAERVLAQGLQDHPDQTRIALALAQLQIARGAWRQALTTLEAGLPYATGNAAYLATTAELEARAGQHAQAARLYESALELSPDHVDWTIALGISLQANGRIDDAREVLRKARDANALDNLQRELIERKLRQLGG